ncbi:hypothetical protein Q8W71_00530 [Methylobacterium sp. NEAU 140]|uniref:hypothetical protein n=1 Tax=Methylobacterium sp. NEAU 140 TaxID=3064945 RepID=UPI0027347CC7|nr:hypothetical protein [Methylobacterium sp. NEAU 140]MDP4021095.1 hypothetical protein [Methylobacterium sp. NEAU 140]
MTTDPTALAKIGEWTGICGDKPEVLVGELAELGFVVTPRLVAERASALEDLRHLEAMSERGREEPHQDADGILCDLLVRLGFEDVVVAWRRVEKWYS